MSWYALENIEEALQDTKSKLLPFNLNTWAKLAVIVFLTGQAVGGPSFTNFPSGGDYSELGATNTGEFSSQTIQNSGFNLQLGGIQPVQDFAVFDAAYTLWIVVGIGLIGVLLLLTYLTSVFQFVMYKSMIDDVKISYARDFLSEGFQYFIFRWITLVTMILVIGVGVGLGSALGLSFNLSGVLIGFVIGFVTLSVFIAILVLRWMAFNIALPEMVRTGSGLSVALKASMQEVKEQFYEVALFWFMKLVLVIGLGIAVLTVLFPVLLILLIPFGFIGFVLMMLSPVLWVPIAILYIISVVIVSMFVAVPVRVYIYNYILEMHEDLLQ